VRQGEQAQDGMGVREAGRPGRAQMARKGGWSAEAVWVQTSSSKNDFYFISTSLQWDSLRLYAEQQRHSYSKRLMVQKEARMMVVRSGRLQRG
jgi:hypothetical protein